MKIFNSEHLGPRGPFLPSLPSLPSTQSPSTTEEDITLTDLIMVDTRAFPQDAITLIERNSDLLESYGIFPEYSPYLGLRQNNSISDNPDPIASYILSLINRELDKQYDFLEV